MLKLSVIQGDITKLAVDAVVNAANEELSAGCGVCGAIHSAAGPALARACGTFGGCPTGQVRVTKGFNLPARWVIHAVGPIWRGGQQREPELLASCYRGALDQAEIRNCETIAFPCISTGIYGYPPLEACQVAVAAVRRFASIDPDAGIHEVIFCCFSTRDGDLYRRELAKGSL